MEKPTRLLLVDDHVLFRKGMASLFADNPEIEVVGEAGDGREAIEKCLELKPDLILMDVHMPGCDGLEATKVIKQERPSTRVVMLTVSDDDEYLFEAIKAGAQGYLLKNMAPEELFDLLRGVIQGEAAITRSMAWKVLEEYAHQGKKLAEPVAPKSNLTAREREVLELVIDGASNREIAAKLVISESTVKNHLHNILEKLHLQNRVQAATYALGEGLIKS
jgi:two-component system, NarL family, nitrate/nitrite response regulator NarL